MADKLNQVSPDLRTFAKEQRSEMTRAEALVWEQVRAGRFQGHKFKRQVPITPYIVDFLCPAARLVVELDGPPHDNPERRARDAERDAWLEGQGFTVLRFPNDLILGGLPIAMARLGDVLRAQLGPSPASLRSAPSPAEGGGLGATRPLPLGER